MTARRVAADGLCAIGIVATLSGIGLLDYRLLMSVTGLIAVIAGLRIHRGIDE